MTTIPTTSTSTAAPTSTTTDTTTGSNTALNSLSGNLTDFLKLLMTQLQNQDPTSPMDTNAFTSQLVQYASVEQQINTNSNLTTLIQATQSNMTLQSSALVGKEVTATNDHLSLQNGSSLVHFTANAAGPVNIAVYSASGEKILQTAVTATAGNNDWTWNGQDSNGSTHADGSYKVAVVDPSGTAIATTVTGTVTGVLRNASSVSLALGALQTDVSTVQSVVNAGS